MSTFEDYLVESFSVLTESIGYIAPAGRILFNKNKVTPDHAASKVWHEGKMHVKTYTSTHGGKTFHVVSSGHHNPKSQSIGSYETFKHARSHKDLPHGKLVGVVNYTNGEKVEHHGEDHSKTAAALHVYK